MISIVADVFVVIMLVFGAPNATTTNVLAQVELLGNAYASVCFSHLKHVLLLITQFICLFLDSLDPRAPKVPAGGQPGRAPRRKVNQR